MGIQEDSEFDAYSDGYQFENYIWVENRRDTEVLLHELQHYLDWLFKYLGCRKEKEFKAYLASYVIKSVLKTVGFYGNP